MGEKLLEIKNLKTTFKTLRGMVTAINGVSFSVSSGEILGIVGESGCGKSVTSQSIMRLYDEKNLAHYEGEVYFRGRNILTLPEKEMEAIRGNEIAMIFQDALSSLDPVFTVGEQIVETIMQHQKVSKEEARRKAVEILKQTGIPAPEKRVNAYPHEMSGGMRQRAMIAMALCCRPGLLIADEPTTALDVTIQAQILDLLRMIQEELDTATILVSHDLGVVARVADRVAIMYAGKIVEIGTAEEVFYDPRHPYTWGLMQSLPGFSRGQDRLHTIPGMPPSLVHLPKGDAFAARNEYALGIDYEQEPPMFQITKTHYAATWLLDERAPKIECPIKRGRNDE